MWSLTYRCLIHVISKAMKFLVLRVTSISFVGLSSRQDHNFRMFNEIIKAWLLSDFRKEPVHDFVGETWMRIILRGKLWRCRANATRHSPPKHPLNTPPIFFLEMRILW